MKPEEPPRPCGTCKAEPGSFHLQGCSVERCALCGGQCIACHCVYELAGLDPEEMEVTHPEIFTKGPTPAMEDGYDRAVQAAGGRLPWEGEYPGRSDCRRLGLWHRAVSDVSGPHQYVRCEADHPDAEPDLNRLPCSARWDRAQRRWER